MELRVHIEEQDTASGDSESVPAGRGPGGEAAGDDSGGGSPCSRARSCPTIGRKRSVRGSGRWGPGSTRSANVSRAICTRPGRRTSSPEAARKPWSHSSRTRTCSASPARSRALSATSSGESQQGGMTNPPRVVEHSPPRRLRERSRGGTFVDRADVRYPRSPHRPSSARIRRRARTRADVRGGR